ncbi:hypothetical protein TWF281_006914 [Arthrobotrys megalospora]
MKCLAPFFLALVAVGVHAETEWPKYKYRVGYEQEIIPQYYPETDDDPVIDGLGRHVKLNFDIQQANLFKGGSCISVFPGANSISLVDIPQNLTDIVGGEENWSTAFGWVMFPRSGACNIDRAEDDPDRERILLSLDQARLGYTQSADMEEFNGFPQPVSFRLYINPALYTLPEGVEPPTDLPFASVGKNTAVPREYIFPDTVIDWSKILPGYSELDKSDSVNRQYAPFGGRIIVSERGESNMAEMERRIPRGRRGYNPDRRQYKPYPGLYSFQDDRRPAEVFKPINVLARLGEDMEKKIITVDLLANVENELDEFAEALMGLPLNPPKPNGPLTPTRYDWPPLSTLSYIRDLYLPEKMPEGVTALVSILPTEKALSFYSRDGHTLSEAIDIARHLNLVVEDWMSLQPMGIRKDQGEVPPAQLWAEEWLGRLEEEAKRNIQDQEEAAEQDSTGERIAEEPNNEGELFESVMIRPPQESLPEGFVLDEAAVEDASLQRSNLDPNFAERIEPLFQPGLSGVVNPNVAANAGPIISNLESRVQSQASSQEIRDQDQNQEANQSPRQQDDVIEEVQREVINQNQIQEGGPEQEALYQEIIQPEIQQGSPGQGVINREALQPEIQQNQGQIPQGNVQQQAQSMGNPSVDNSIDLGNVGPLGQSMQQFGQNLAGEENLLGTMNALYNADRRNNLLQQFRPGGRTRSPGPDVR